jgi:hypothetical protein
VTLNTRKENTSSTFEPEVSWKNTIETATYPGCLKANTYGVKTFFRNQGISGQILLYSGGVCLGNKTSQSGRSSGKYFCSANVSMNGTAVKGSSL